MRPSLATTREIAYGSQCTPRFATVAYPEVICRGDTGEVPSVSGHTGTSAFVIPILAATRATESGPTSSITCAKTVFTESAVASHSGKSPAKC